MLTILSSFFLQAWHYPPVIHYSYPHHTATSSLSDASFSMAAFHFSKVAKVTCLLNFLLSGSLAFADPFQIAHARERGLGTPAQRTLSGPAMGGAVNKRWMIFTEIDQIILQK